jgi:chromosome segregation ATPase
MDDAQIIAELENKIKNIEERLRAVEKEQRNIREDILSGKAEVRMQKRLLENPQKKIKDMKDKLDEEIKIEI